MTSTDIFVGNLAGTSGPINFSSLNDKDRMGRSCDVSLLPNSFRRISSRRVVITEQKSSYKLEDVEVFHCIRPRKTCLKRSRISADTKTTYNQRRLCQRCGYFLLMVATVFHPQFLVAPSLAFTTCPQSSRKHRKFPPDYKWYSRSPSSEVSSWLAIFSSTNDIVERPGPTTGPNTTDLFEDAQSDVHRLTSNGGYSHTKASRAKISAANKGKVPWNKGKTRSEETKARIAAGVRRKNRERFLKKLADLGLTEEEYNTQEEEKKRQKKEKLAGRRTASGGYRPTEETRRKISKVLKEKHATGEIKKKPIDPSKVRRGFKHSEETRQKISESLRKRWANDPEYRQNQMAKSENSSLSTRQKISETLRKKWQDPTFRQDMLNKMAQRKGNGPKDPSHREKISAAIRLKWQDDAYRKKTMESIARRSAELAKKRPPKPPPVKKPKQVVIKAPVVPKKAAVNGKRKSKPVRPAVKATPVAAARPVTPKQKPTVKVSKTSKQQTTRRTTETTKNGSVDRLREERRDLYDLLYGEDEAVSSAFSSISALADENLDNFDPYGLEDF